MTDAQPDHPNESDPPRNRGTASEPAWRLIMARPVAPAANSPDRPFPYARAPYPVPYPQAVPLARRVSPIHLDMPWWKALLQLVPLPPLLVIGMLVGAGAALLFGHGDDTWFNVFASSGMGLASLLYVVLLVSFGKSPARTIGWTFRDGSLNAAIGIAALILFYCVAFAIAFTIMLLLSRTHPEILTAEPESAQAIQEVFPRMSFPTLLGLMTFVAVWEEIVFRGFLLTRLRAIVKHWWLAIFIGAFLFSFGHIYQGVLGMFLTFVLGIILGALFVWRKSLIPGIVYHICQNVLAIQMVQWLYSGP